MVGHSQLTPEKRAAVVARLSAGQSDLSIARDEHVNRKTVAKIRKKLTLATDPFADMPMDAAGMNAVAPSQHVLGGTPADRKIVRLEGEVSRLRRALKDAHSDRDMEDAVLQIVGDLANASPQPPEWMTNPPKRRAQFPRRFEVPVLSTGDWHAGEVVSRAETNGVNEYNLDIADQRIGRLVSTGIELAHEHHKKDYPGVVLNVVGDIVSGGIHPELAKTDEVEVYPAIEWSIDRLEGVVRRLADAFGMVFVICVPGNHGRNTLKPEFKRYAYKNADWLIYRLTAARFNGDKRVQFQIPVGGIGQYRVFHKRFALIHGDMMGVAGGDGIIGAIGPIMRGEIKTRGRMMSLGNDYDHLILGHYHPSPNLWLPRAVVNGTVKGYDEYAQNKLNAIPGPPTQALFFVHPKWGITSKWDVILETPAHVVDSAAWVTVFNKAA